MLADPFIKVGKRLRRALSKEEGAGARAKRELYALRDVSTVLEPCRVYLVIGGPKSGKTSLLQAIAGEPLDVLRLWSGGGVDAPRINRLTHAHPGRPPRGRNVTVSGSVLYNGERAEKDAGFNITRTCICPIDGRSGRSNESNHRAHSIPPTLLNH